MNANGRHLFQHPLFLRKYKEFLSVAMPVFPKPHQLHRAYWAETAYRNLQKSDILKLSFPYEDKTVTRLQNHRNNHDKNSFQQMRNHCW